MWPNMFADKTKKPLDKNTLAVILIDMQTRFVEHLRTGEAERIIPNQLTALKHCNKTGIPIIVLEYDSRKHSSFGKTIAVLRSEAKKNSKGCLIRKEWNSGFVMTGLHSYLESLRVKNLFLMGINADHCVKQTAKDAIRRGYEIATSKDVISGQERHSKDNSLRWFQANGHHLDSVTAFTEII